MDVIRVRIFGLHQRRRRAADAIERQAVRRVDPRNAQDHNADCAAPGPGAQHAFGMDAALPALALRARRAMLFDHRAAAVSIDAARADVDQALWYAGPAL